MSFVFRPWSKTNTSLREASLSETLTRTPTTSLRDATRTLRTSD
ncbi:MAG: hypothetical protein ACYTX0_17240 [Nostoc sp.]